MTSTLELRWTDRILSGAQTPRRFLDFVIDGQSLYEQMGDHISPLGWGSPEESQKAVDRFLRKAEPDFPNGRTSLYVCAECGDLGCGAVSIVIERMGDEIIWRDFGYENNYDDEVLFEDFKGWGPFSFDASEYYLVVSSALSLKDN
jgi:hypothetical protein